MSNVIRYAGDPEFGNSIFEGMDSYLKDNFQEEPEVAPENVALAELTSELVKCANFLEELGHPAARQADEVLYLFAKELIRK